MAILGNSGQGQTSLLGNMTPGKRLLTSVAFGLMSPETRSGFANSMAQQEEERKRQEALQRFMQSSQGKIPPEVLAGIEAGVIPPTALGQMMGYGGAEAPANVREWDHYSQLSPDQQRQYLEMKRASQMMNLGNQFAVRDPVSNQAAAIPGSQIQLGPDQTPQYKYNASAAATQGEQDVRAVTEPGIRSDVASATAIGEARGKKASEAPGKIAEGFDSLSDLQEFRTNPHVKNIYGTISGATPNVRQESVDAAALRSKVAGTISLAARGKIAGQGPVTEGDQKLLDRAVAIISDPRISYKMAMDEAAKAEEIIRRSVTTSQEVLGSPGVAPVKRLRYNPQTGQFE